MMNSVVKISVLSVAILFAALMTNVELLHNHEADFHEHEACPAYLIRVLLVATTIAFFLTFLFRIFPSQRFFSQKDDVYSPLFCTLCHANRSPPPHAF
jgi:hypothetical protein